MSLNKEDLAKKLLKAEKSSLSGKLEKKEEAKLKEKCDLIAQAVEDFVKQASVVVDIPTLVVSTAAGPGTTTPTPGVKARISWACKFYFF